MNAYHRTIQQLRSSYEYFEPRTWALNHMSHLYNVEPCEICGTLLQSPNGISVNVSPGTLLAHGFKQGTAPPENGGWSEMHEMATCGACCYDPDALTKHAVEKVRVHEVDDGVVHSHASKLDQ